MSLFSVAISIEKKITNYPKYNGIVTIKISSKKLVWPPRTDPKLMRVLDNKKDISSIFGITHLIDQNRYDEIF